MEKIIWNDQFSVGVKKMEVQHQKIIRIFNTLVDNAQANAGSETVSKMLAEMVEYASEHFKCEEQLLRDHAHPDLEQQKAGHSEFRRRAGELCQIALNEEEEVTQDLINFLHDWWTNHILHKDKKYAEFFEEKRNMSS